MLHYTKEMADSVYCMELDLEEQDLAVETEGYGIISEMVVTEMVLEAYSMGLYLPLEGVNDLEETVQITLGAFVANGYEDVRDYWYGNLTAGLVL